MHATLDNGRSVGVFCEDSEDRPADQPGPVVATFDSDLPDERRLDNIPIERLADLDPVLEWLSVPWEDAEWPGMIEGSA